MKEFPLKEQELLEDIQGILRIKSVGDDCGPVTEQAPFGQGIYDAIEYVMELGRKMGFRAKNVDGMCGWVEMGEGDEMMAVLAHVDTVAVEKEGWIAPPFDGTIIDGRMYGRGVGDDKGPAMVALYAMKAVADSGVPLKRRVRLIVGGNEESGSRCMARYKETEELPVMAFTPDANYPAIYAEKGGVMVKIGRKLDDSITPMYLESGNTANIVPAYAKAKVNGKEYEARGVAAHAMQPHKGVNAMLKLCGQLREEGVQHPYLELAKILNVEGLNIQFSDEPSGDLTINPSIIRVDEHEASVICDIRCPVTLDMSLVAQNIQAAVEPLGFEVMEHHEFPPLYVRKDSPLITTLQRVYKEVTGDDTEPVSTGGGTYARSFDNAVAFGSLFPWEEETFHQTNENWAIDSIRKNFQIMANAIVELNR